MLKEFIEKIMEIDDDPIQVDKDGREYSIRNLAPVKMPESDAVDVHSLTGLVDLLAVEKYEGGRVKIQVQNGDTVRVVSGLYGDFKQRETFIAARAMTNNFTFDRWYDLESFNIAMMTQFVQTEETAKILALLGNVSDNNVTMQSDDGVTQTVNQTAGVTLKEKADIPNLFTLAPFRTFPELKQPESKYVLRVRSGQNGLTAALFVADSDLWEMTAIERAAAWLRKALDEYPKNMPGVSSIDHLKKTPVIR